MEDAYYSWLVGLIGDNYVAQNYQKLLWKLYATDYIWELDYDRNRAADGLYLRREYGTETGVFMDILLQNKNCSVLEMMVALARRAEHDIMHDPDYGDRSGLWFWTMLQNLGLDIYDDWNWYENEVNRILDVFLHRRYERSGAGGAFPCHFTNGSGAPDLRSVDLWRQMNTYLEEHYPV